MEDCWCGWDILSTKQKVDGRLAKNRNHVRTALPRFIEYVLNLSKVLKMPAAIGQEIGACGVLVASGPVFVVVIVAVVVVVVVTFY